MSENEQPATDGTLTLVKRLKDYFAMDARSLMNDYKKLTDADKQWFAAEFNKMGLPTTLM